MLSNRRLLANTRSYCRDVEAVIDAGGGSWLSTHAEGRSWQKKAGRGKRSESLSAPTHPPPHDAPCSIPVRSSTIYWRN